MRKYHIGDTIQYQGYTALIIGLWEDFGHLGITLRLRGFEISVYEEDLP